MSHFSSAAKAALFFLDKAAEYAALHSRTGRPTPLPHLAIDGRCASGKTTLSAAIAEEAAARGIRAAVIHLDHFFLRPEQRTPERLSLPGGNFDLERFTEEVLPGLKRREPFAFRILNCSDFTLGNPQEVPASDLYVLEGSYSCHPALWEHFGLHVFMTVTPETQLKRLELRESPQSLERFKKRWIPMEEAYFQAFRVEEKCEYKMEVK